MESCTPNNAVNPPQALFVVRWQFVNKQLCRLAVGGHQHKVDDKVVANSARMLFGDALRTATTWTFTLQSHALPAKVIPFRHLPVDDVMELLHVYVLTGTRWKIDDRCSCSRDSNTSLGIRNVFGFVKCVSNWKTMVGYALTWTFILHYGFIKHSDNESWRDLEVDEWW